MNSVSAGAVPFQPGRANGRTAGPSPKQKGGQGVVSPDGLPPFLASDNLKPFVSEDLKRATVPVVFRSPPTGKGHGVFRGLPMTQAQRLDLYRRVMQFQ